MVGLPPATGGAGGESGSELPFSLLFCGAEDGLLVVIADLRIAGAVLVAHYVGVLVVVRSISVIKNLKCRHYLLATVELSESREAIDGERDNLFHSGR